MNKKRILLLLTIAIALAIFEIQIEGSAGWAKNLPCWRALAGSWQQTLYGLLMNGKPCDGFHLSEVFLLIVMFHLPFVYGVKWNFSQECEIMAGFFTTAVCWDFLWFIFNPAYGWEKFKPENIWWHMHWIGPFPQDYYGGMTTVAGLILLASWKAGKNNFSPTAKRITKDMLGLISLTACIAVIWEIF